MFALFGLTSLREKTLSVLVLVLLATLAGFWFYHWTTTKLLTSELTDARNQIGVLTIAKATLEVEKKSLTISLDKQTKAIADLIQAQQQASDAAQLAINKAKADSAKWRNLYQGILNSPRPPGTDCEALGIKINQYLVVRQSEVTQ